MRNRLLSAALVVALALPLGGCLETVSEWLDFGRSTYSAIVSTLPTVARDIDYACAALRSTSVTPAAPATCMTKVTKVKAAWRSICANTSLLSDNVAGNYVAKIKADVAAAQKAC